MSSLVPLPNDLIYYIMKYDYELLCIAHLHFRIPIRSSDCSYNLLRHVIKKNSFDLFLHCFEKTHLSYHFILELFEFSIMYDNEDITRYLYTNYKISNDIIHEYLVYGIQENCLNTVYFLIADTEIPLDTNDYEILTEAVRAENKPLVKYLMNQPRLQDPSSGENTPFKAAIETQNYPIFIYLLNHHKIDPHEPSNEPFKFALDIGDSYIIQKMLNNRYILSTLQLEDYEKDRLNEILE